MTVVPEIEMEEDQYLEFVLHKVKEVVRELCEKIIDLEGRVVPTTPPEELECRQNELQDVVAHLTAFEE